MPETNSPGGEERRDLTRLLEQVRGGDAAARERLFELVYSELKVLARRQLRRSGAGETLRTTALVHEAYLRLARPENAPFHDQVHFFAVAARAMRQIVIDHVRAVTAAKRGEGRAPLPIDEVPGAGRRAAPLEAELLTLNFALEELEEVDPRLGRVVELRFFGGLTVDEVGEALGIAQRTVKRDWRRARAFLQMRLSADLQGSLEDDRPAW